MALRARARLIRTRTGLRFLNVHDMMHADRGTARTTITGMGDWRGSPVLRSAAGPADAHDGRIISSIVERWEAIDSDLRGQYRFERPAYIDDDVLVRCRP